MEMLDRYLESVRHCLPEGQRDDIINELGENLRSQIEDKEAELERPLNEAELEALLKQHGHPLIVAGRYRQDQRSLAFGRQWISPMLFPFYVRVLKFNLGLTSLILIGVFVALFASGQSVTLLDAVPPFVYQFLIQFTVITVIFAVADRHWALHPDRWDPRNLKRPWHPAFAIQSQLKGIPAATKDPNRVSRFDSIAHLVGLGIGLIWLRVAQQAPFFIFGPAAAFIKPAPIWHAFYLPVLILWIGGMVRAVINLLRPDWTRLPQIYHAITQVAWIVILSLILRAGPWVMLTVPAASGSADIQGHRHVVEVLNQLIEYGGAVLAVLSIYTLFRIVRGLLRRSRTGNSSSTPVSERASR